MDIPTITNENIYEIFGLDEEDMICIEKFKESGEGRLSPEKIQEFKDFNIEKYYPEIKNIIQNEKDKTVSISKDFFKTPKNKKTVKK